MHDPSARPRSRARSPPRRPRGARSRSRRCRPPPRRGDSVRSSMAASLESPTWASSMVRARRPAGKAARPDTRCRTALTGTGMIRDWPVTVGARGAGGSASWTRPSAMPRAKTSVSAAAARSPSPRRRPCRSGRRSRPPISPIFGTHEDRTLQPHTTGGHRPHSGRASRHPRDGAPGRGRAGPSCLRDRYGRRVPGLGPAGRRSAGDGCPLTCDAAPVLQTVSEVASDQNRDQNSTLGHAAPHGSNAPFRAGGGCDRRRASLHDVPSGVDDVHADGCAARSSDERALRDRRLTMSPCDSPSFGVRHFQVPSHSGCTAFVARYEHHYATDPCHHQVPGCRSGR